MPYGLPKRNGKYFSTIQHTGINNINTIVAVIIGCSVISQRDSADQCSNVLNIGAWNARITTVLRPMNFKILKDGIHIGIIIQIILQQIIAPANSTNEPYVLTAILIFVLNLAHQYVIGNKETFSHSLH